MTIQEVQQKPLTDDDFVLAEVDKLQTIFKLKQEMRYDGTRAEEPGADSVAEHVFGMYLLANYFLPLEDPEHTWDRDKINQMILWHDVDEVITGDIIGYLKTDEDRAREREATEQILADLPKHIEPTARAIITEYEARTSIEAKFTKAIDKIEPTFHLFNEYGKQITLEKQTTLDQHQRIKLPFMQEFLYIARVAEVVTNEMIEQGFFVSD